jgi:hypothetical protein
VLPDVPSPTPLLPLGVVLPELLLIDVSPDVFVEEPVVPHAANPIVRMAAAETESTLLRKFFIVSSLRFSVPGSTADISKSGPFRVA